MARACPACGRPNADLAEKCLYCVSPLSPVEADPELPPLLDTAAPVIPAPGSPVSPISPISEAPPARYLLILIPGEPPDDPLVQEFAEITGTSLYEARLSLSSRRARLFRRLDSESEARRLSEELGHARVAHYVTAEASVLSLPVAKCTGLELRDRHLELRLEGSPEANRAIPYASVLLLVRGEITRERHHEKRISSSRGVTRRLTAGLRLHLYEREASVAIEIEPERFDFRLLGPERTASALLNLEKLLARLASEIPEVEIDRGFEQEPVVLARASSGEDVADVLVDSERGPEGVLYDNESSFRYYARWRYRLARHLASLPGPASL